MVISLETPITWFGSNNTYESQENTYFLGNQATTLDFMSLFIYYTYLMSIYC